MRSSGIRPLRIGVTYDLRSKFLQSDEDLEATADLTEDDTIDAIQATLEELGHSVDRIGCLDDLVQRLAGEDVIGRAWDLVLNLCEGIKGRSRGTQVPALLEAYDIPFTFADAAAIGDCVDKAKTKMMLQHHSIPTAPFMVVGESVVPDLEVISSMLKRHNLEASSTRPLFIKLAWEGSSKGISSRNKVTSVNELCTMIRELRDRFQSQELVVEKFVDGREFTVSIIGTDTNARVIAVSEYVWLDRDGDSKTEEQPDFLTHDLKMETFWDYCDDFNVDTKQDDEAAEAGRIALDAHRALRCRDLSRVDVRSIGSSPQILEINAIAGIQPGYSDLPRAACREGWTYPELLQVVLESCLERM